MTLRLTPCSCGLQYLVRMNRAPWMRLVPTRRHYFCAKCKQPQFLPRRAFASWWLPRAVGEDSTDTKPRLDAATRGSRMRALR
ncbi:MAG TPA: hypothetical protein VFM98_05680 [Ramlibacter sp.]|uniref:hypothetical protein n=1 Tax=Ramlibacter sp. TaxID=1917967 RepID=UPI002D7E8C6B|nr:hypothetical protein [Ramlibacter sp.]HET8745072.1 hypothetical protein [Ramlibacter sp.]